MDEIRVLPGGFTNATRGFDTVLCLDTSGSMAGRGIAELKRACLALIDAARASPVPENIALVAFGGSARLLAPLTNDFARLRSIVNSISAEGGTPMKDGLVLAYTELIQHGGPVRMRGYQVNPRIILMTDGQPDPGTRPEVLVAGMILGPRHAEAGLPYSAPIACVGCGGDVDRELLQTLARVTRGMYKEVSDLSELAAFFTNQALLLSFIARVEDLRRLQNVLELRRFLDSMGRHVSEDDAAALHGLLLAMILAEHAGAPPASTSSAAPTSGLRITVRAPSTPTATASSSGSTGLTRPLLARDDASGAPPPEASMAVGMVFCCACLCLLLYLGILIAGAICWSQFDGGHASSSCDPLTKGGAIGMTIGGAVCCCLSCFNCVRSRKKDRS